MEKPVNKFRTSSRGFQFRNSIFVDFENVEMKRMRVIPPTPLDTINWKFRKSRQSILGEEMGTSNLPQLGNIFNAIENKSLSHLQYYLDRDPRLINTRGGPYLLTPLHFAIEESWVEGVRVLLNKGASVLAENQFKQTPLHYAAKVKEIEIMSLLLSASEVSEAIDVRDIRGMSPLHIAASSDYLPGVELLLENNAVIKTTDLQKESPLHKAAKSGAYEVMVALMERGGDLREKDVRGVSVMKWLCLSTKNGLQKLMDHLLQTSAGGTNGGSPITFNFAPLVSSNRGDTQQCKLLSYFIETGNRHILAHPVCHVFILIKWRTVKYIFYSYLFYFLLYTILTVTFIFLPRVRYNLTSNNNNNNNSNTTTTTTTPYNELPTGILTIQILLTIMTVTIVVNQLYHLKLQGLVYLKASTFWLQIASCVLLVILLALYWCPVQYGSLEDNISSVELLLLQLQFLFIFRKFPSYGLYVAMFIKVTTEFLKLFAVYCCLLISFTGIMYLIFNTRDDHQGNDDPVNSSLGLLFLKTVTMMVGSVEVDDTLALQLNSLPYTGHFLFFLCVVLISIVLANLLVALAVSDIRELRASAHLTRLASMVESILTMEQSWTFPLLRRLDKYCRLDPQSTHVRLWPQEDSRHPSVLVEVRNHHNSGCWSRVLERFHPSRYQVHIPGALKEEVLARIIARDSKSIDQESLDNPRDLKVFFDEVINRLKSLEENHLH